MALTIHQQPSSTLYIPINNPVEYLVSSTNTSERNFKLSCKIVVGGTEIKELKYDVIPSTAFVIAEIQRLLKGFADDGETNLVNEESTLKRETGMEETARAVFQEWYSSNTTSNPTYQGTQASGTAFYIWNGAFKYREWQNEDWKNYTLSKYLQASGSNISTYKINTCFTNYKGDATIITNVGSTPEVTNLSLSDRFKKITLSQLFRLYYFIREYNTASPTDIRSYLTFYNADFSHDTAINPILIDNLTNPLNNSNQILSKNYSKAFMENAANWTTNLNISNITEQYAKYFTVIVGANLMGNGYSIPYLYEIDWNACSKYDSYEIHWLNHLGGWDSWVFDKRSNKQIITQRDWYTQPVTRRIESNTIIHDAYARKKKQYYTGISERYTVNSGILKDWEYDGLIDLLQSPKVYWRHPDYGMIAINIVDKDTIAVPRQVNEKAYNLNFVFEIDNQDKLQGQ